MPEYTLKDLHDLIQTDVVELRHRVDDQQTQLKARGDKDTVLETSITQYSTRIGELETQVSTLQAELKRVRSAPTRPIVALPYGGYTVDTNHDDLPAEEKSRHDLFFKGLRSGYQYLTDEDRVAFRNHFAVKRGSDFDERQTTAISAELDGGPGREGKALVLGDETTGGYLAPPEFVTDIIKGVQLISPIRPMATIRQTSRRSVQYPVRSGVMAAKWTAETGTRTETAGLTFALEEIPNHEMYALVFVSDQDLEDSVFNLEQEILDNCTEQFAKAEGAAFVSGSGVGQPEGIMTNPSVSQSVQGTGGGSALIAQGLINIWGDLKTAYAQQATWLMNRQTIAACRALVDGQGRYLWEPGLADGTPPNLLGSPYVEVPDMPAIAGNAFPIAYGNIKRAYLIVDRINVVVRRLQEKYAESGQVAYLVRKRVGGQVVLSEAVRKLKISVS